MDLSQYLDMFLAESKEHLDSLNNNLLLLEKEPGNIVILNEIFRSAHTLKGMAATMGFEQITELTHEMESTLMLFKEEKLSVNPEVMDVLLRCLDALEEMIKDPEAIDGQVNLSSPLITKLRALGETRSRQPASTGDVALPESYPAEFNEYELSVLQAAEKSNYRAFYLKVGIAPGTVMKSVRAFMVFRSLEEVGQIIKCHPPVQDLEEEKFEDSFEMVLLSQKPPEQIAGILEKISEVIVLSLQQIDISKISHYLRKADSELGTDYQAVPEKSDIVNMRSSRGVVHDAIAFRTVRVDIGRLDMLMNLVGELVINKTRLEQIGLSHRLSELLEAIEQMGRLTTDLQSLVMKVRMVPIRQVFNRFPRMVRDFARELHKDVEFIMEGQDTELDRTVIDEIGDPLVHLIRNALDHGVEPQEERAQAGKTKTALLRLAARQDGNSVVIEVEDDGRGIDLEKVRRKALAKGIITEKEEEYVNERALLKLIYEPGFSTADVVTDLSGRGVGMDVVKSKIESLNGNIEIETKKNQGTKVKISLPLTLAIIQALLVSVGGEQYAIPLSSIDETTFITPEQIKTVKGQEVMLLRGAVLPLLRLESLLDVKTAASENRDLFVVVVRKGECQTGLVVDALVGQQEIVIKSLGKLLSGTKGFAGATILGNGQVSLIIDISSLL